MRQLHSDFHFRHALFALQGPDGYVDALLESARDRSDPLIFNRLGDKSCPIARQRRRPDDRPLAAWSRAA